MTQPGASSGKDRAFFLTPEIPSLGSGGGGLRSVSVLEYLRSRYDVQVATFTLPYHSKNAAARVWRNGLRVALGRPPLFDRFAGFESQIASQISGHYRVAVVEHFWCAPYAALLRPHTDLLLLDLHNIESELAATHARAVRWPLSTAFSRFAASYRRLEQQWVKQFDVVLAASESDRSRVEHGNVHVYPNALPEVARPAVAEQDCIVFSGNMEYHPNVEAVRWFRRRVWPRVRERCPRLEWRLVGRNPHAIERLVEGDSRIVLTGAVDDAVEAVAAAKICIVPLLSGSGTRFKILEAWAAARAVISTSIGAEGLAARTGEHLLIADEPHAFENELVALLTTPETRRRLGENGRKLYLDRYTWKSAWRALEAARL